MNVELLADSTVEIKIGSETVGSGFRFVDADIVVTNAHVLPPTVEEVPVVATTSSGDETELRLLDVSPEPQRGGHDYAILRTIEDFGATAEVLQPATDGPARGDTVWFAGHPYEISEPLVHSATVSGPHSRGFYLDGSVNFGNSGGPIVSAETTDVFGIVTKSEIYRNRSLEESIEDLNAIQQQLAQIQEVHETTINRVDVEALAITSVQEIQDAVDILSDNVSSGIGVGYSIEPVIDGLDSLDSSGGHS